MIDARKYPHERYAVHLRQKRASADFFGKIKSVRRPNYIILLSIFSVECKIMKIKKIPIDTYGSL